MKTKVVKRENLKIATGSNRITKPMSLNPPLSKNVYIGRKSSLNDKLSGIILEEYCETFSSRRGPDKCF